MKRSLILITICCMLSFLFAGCGNSSLQSQVDDIMLQGDVRLFYPAKWYVEKATIADGALQQDLLIAMGDSKHWETINRKEYEEVQERATDRWYQFASTKIDGAVVFQPYNDVDYIRMEWEGEESFFLAKDKPSDRFFPLLEKNESRITYDEVK